MEINLVCSNRECGKRLEFTEIRPLPGQGFTATVKECRCALEVQREDAETFDRLCGESVDLEMNLEDAWRAVDKAKAENKAALDTAFELFEEIKTETESPNQAVIDLCNEGLNAVRSKEKRLA